MSIHQKVREILGINHNPTALIQLRPEVLVAVEEIAMQNGRTVAEVANELIGHALYDHQLAADSLQTWQQLTQREREITALIWLGLTNPQIAERLLISTNTVKTHVKNILAKFNVNSKKKLADLLSGLDLSEWADLASHTSLSPPSTDSPHGVSPQNNLTIPPTR